MPTIVCVSDTHGQHDELDLPPADILVVAGDVTLRGRVPEVEAFDAWLAKLGDRYRHKIVVAGNHDFLFERSPAEARGLIRHAVYLQDEAITVDGLKFYGSPWSVYFFDWAFNLQRGEPLAAKWRNIPDDTDVLLTHSPPGGVLDQTARGEHAGCYDLLERVKSVKPRLHVFGHIHEAAGSVWQGETLCVNASIQKGKPVVVRVEKGKPAELV